tara:strand:+ start:333 stop:482 length:150 start_codon:yes stop_codon:yes gene_type:complete
LGKTHLDEEERKVDALELYMQAWRICDEKEELSLCIASLTRDFQQPDIL